MKIFDPTAAAETRDVVLAPRPAALTGLRIGVVENTKFNADALLLKLAERLGRQHGMTLARVHRKRSPSHEVEEGAIAAFKERVDLAISGIGD